MKDFAFDLQRFGVLYDGIYIYGDADDTYEDVISNSVNGRIIHSGKKDDVVTNSGNGVRIEGGPGNNYIGNSGDNVYIDAGSDNDSVVNTGSGVKIIVGLGEDHIKNHGDGASISAGGDTDRIDNFGNYATIYGGPGKDVIYNSGEDVYINAGDDQDDYVNNSGDNTQIDCGNGANKIENSGKDVVINAGGGKNVVLNKGYGTDGTKIWCTDGNDSIVNDGGSHITIGGGTGENTLRTGNGDHVVLWGGTDNDTLIAESGFYITIDGSDGNNYISNGAGFATLLGGSGKDTVIADNKGNSSGRVNNENINYINTGSGDDSIINRSTYSNILTGTGQDSVYNYADNVEIYNKDISNSDYHGNYIDNEGSHVTIASDVVAPLPSIDFDKLNETIDNNGSNVNIILGYGSDSIKNYGTHTTIRTGVNNDTVRNFGSDVEIYAGGTDDSIDNYADNVEIYGEYGEDILESCGKEVLIDGGPKNDKIFIGSISKSAVYAAFEQPADEVVDAFFQKITNGLYSPVQNLEAAEKSGNVEKIQEALSEIEEACDEITSNPLFEKLEKSAATGSQTNAKKALGATCKTIKTVGKYAGKASGYMEVAERASRVLNRWNEDKDIIAMGIAQIKNDFYITDAGYISIKQPAFYETTRYIDANVTVIGGTGDDYIKNESTANGLYRVYEYNVGDGNDIIYGASNDDTLRLNTASYVTKRNGDDLIVQVGSGSITFKDIYKTFKPSGFSFNRGPYPVIIESSMSSGNKVASGVQSLNVAEPDLPENLSIINSVLKAESNFSGSIDTRADYAENVKKVDASQTSNDVEIIGNSDLTSILSGNGSDTIHNTASDAVVNSAYGNDDIFNLGDSVKINSGAGNDNLVGVGDNVTLNLGKGDDFAYFEGINTMYQYVAGDGNDTIYGFDENDTLKVTGAKYSTVKSGNDLIVKVEDESITLKDVSTANIATDQKITWTISGTTATCKLNNKIVTKITGLKKGTKAKYLSLSGSTVKISKEALTTTKVTISNGYTLALASDVPNPKSLESGWEVNGTKAYYKTSRKSAGYILAPDKKSIKHSAKSGTNSITITGLKKGTSASNLSLNGTTVTVSKAALTTSKVSITGNYTLALADDYSQKIIPAAWAVNGTTATYKSARKTVGYTLAVNKKAINFLPATTSKNLATITGLKKGTTAADISMNGKAVTISAKMLGTKNVTISKGYTLALADDVAERTKADLGWKINGTTATYKGEKISAGYALSSNKKSVIYSKEAVIGAGSITVNGLKNGATAKDLYKFSGQKFVLINSSIIGSTGASIKGTSAGYSFMLSGNKESKLVNIGAAASLIGATENDSLIGGIGNDSILGDDGNDYLNGGAGNDKLFGGAGNDSILGGGGNDLLNGGAGDDTLFGGGGNDNFTGGVGKDVFVYSGGKDVITDYTAGEDTIRISSGKITKTQTSGKDIIYTIGKGTLTVKGGKGKDITIENSTSGLFAEDNFAVADDLSAIVENNLSAVSEIETQNFDTLTQENLITYAK